MTHVCACCGGEISDGVAFIIDDQDTAYASPITARLRCFPCETHQQRCNSCLPANRHILRTHGTRSHATPES